ncbi:DUF6300 family protein [Streptomyces sp. OZ13]|uniref:DUF6300 family protein n=1 Tax=Streptomyces sp. OZ13 TaxID=3452210 RepID=UPI003F8C4E19
MDHIELSDQLPSCSRCGGEVLSSVVMPQTDAAGRPIHLQLCPACDADKPAASALLAWLADGGGHDPSRTQEGAMLLMEWTKEGMAEHGWHWAESPTGTPPPAGADGHTGPESLTGTPADLSMVERLTHQRDALRARLTTAPPDEREQIRTAIRELGKAVAHALAEADVTAEALRATAPQPAPGPLSPEAEQRIRDLYERLAAEEERRDNGT